LTPHPQGGAGGPLSLIICTAPHQADLSHRSFSAFVAHLNNPHGLHVYLAHISHLCEQADSIPDSLVLFRDRVVFLGLKMRRVLVLLSTAHLPGLPA